MILLELTPDERELLRVLLAQYDEIVRGGDDDPVLERLFPVAYRDDAEAAAEFAMYTRSGLVDHKTSGAGRIVAALVDDQPLLLDEESAARWLPVLTDLRLIIAGRLGILRDDDEVPDDELGQIYHWLAGLQQHLIESLEAS